MKKCPTGEQTFPLGFGLFQVDSGGYQIQKIDDIEEVEYSHKIKVEKTFDCDSDAALETQKLADAGNEVCRKSIEFLIDNKSSDVEYFKLMKNW
jgi:hypothetical protein